YQAVREADPAHATVSFLSPGNSGAGLSHGTAQPDCHRRIGRSAETVIARDVADRIHNDCRGPCADRHVSDGGMERCHKQIPCRKFFNCRPGSPID
ncbi:MAG TPA: hypothetical protein VFL57_20525, partial [Bryobacteraceae bacterium]|nr:hypothetical protein [Bryobacteraceae bacterium]